MTNSLPPQTPHEPDDLLPGEAELRALYGKLPQNEPSAALDVAVLRAAAEAVSWERAVTTTRIPAARKGRSRPPRWLVGLSSAATLVLAAGLAWHMRGMPQADNLPVPTEAISAKAMSDSATDSSANSALTNAPVAMLKPAVVPPPPPMPVKPLPPPRVIQAARSQRAMEAVAERAKSQAARKQVQPAMPPPAPAAPSALGEVAPAPAAPQGRAADDKAAAQRRVSPQVMSVPTIRPPAPTFDHSPPAPSAPPAPPAPAQETTLTEAAANTNESAMQTASAAQRNELEAIRELFVEHHDEEAQQRLEAFHRRYPQQSLPPDLQTRLRKP